MALIIRLRQQGAKNAQTYRLVVTDKKNPRDGKYIEKLGWYNPHAKEGKEYVVDGEKVAFWLNNGAEISESAVGLVARAAPESLKEYKERATKKRAKARSKVKAKTATPKKAAAPRKKVATKK